MNTNEEQLHLGLSGSVYTASEAADLLGVHAVTVKRWANDGTLPKCYRLNPEDDNSPWRIPVQSVNDHLAKRFA